MDITKKAMMGAFNLRKIVSWIVGIIILVLGLIYILNKFNVISFSIPTFPQMVLWVLTIIGGIFLIFDAITEGSNFSSISKMLMIISFVIAILIIALSLIPLLNNLTIISFQLPEIAQLIKSIIYVLAGFFLIIGGMFGY